MWNYLSGGKDNYGIDRATGDAMAEFFPDIFHVARQSREFLHRTVHHVASECGVRQFLDIGCGLPAPEPLLNTHEVAQRVDPNSRVVYVDNDKVVLAHARALLVSPIRGAGQFDYIDADIHHIDYILTEARRTLNFDEPIAVILFGILGHVREFADALDIVARVMDMVPPGSYLLQEDGYDNGADHSAEVREGVENRNKTGIEPYHLRSTEQIAQYFNGLELLEPGLVTLTEWHPGTTNLKAVNPVASYGGVGRKP